MKIKLFLGTIFIIFIFMFVFLYTYDDKKIIKKDNILYAIKVNETDVYNLPEPGNFLVNIKCENATGIWDYINWQLVIDDISGEVKCNLDFTSTEPINLNEYILQLSGNGQVFEDNGFRYQGKNVNNFISFNNELWRIIGVFDVTLGDGVTSERLVKLVKDGDIGTYSIDYSNRNTWSESDLLKILNDVYYESTDGTDLNICYAYPSIKNTCDFTNSGINNFSKDYVENVLWKLGELEDSAIQNVIDVYESETDLSAISNAAKIGLISVSDYGYSIPTSSCPRNTTLSMYSSESCSGNSWMYGYGKFWLLAKQSINIYNFWYASHSGSIWGQNVNQDNIIIPSLYLKSDVKYLGGEGTEKDPFQISF